MCLQRCRKPKDGVSSTSTSKEISKEELIRRRQEMYERAARIQGLKETTKYSQLEQSDDVQLELSNRGDHKEDRKEEEKSNRKIIDHPIQKKVESQISIEKKEDKKEAKDISNKSSLSSKPERVVSGFKEFPLETRQEGYKPQDQKEEKTFNNNPINSENLIDITEEKKHEVLEVKSQTIVPQLSEEELKAKRIEKQQRDRSSQIQRLFTLSLIKTQKKEGKMFEDLNEAKKLIPIPQNLLVNSEFITIEDISDSILLFILRSPDRSSSGINEKQENKIFDSNENKVQYLLDSTYQLLNYCPQQYSDFSLTEEEVNQLIELTLNHLNLLLLEPQYFGLDAQIQRENHLNMDMKNKNPFYDALYSEFRNSFCEPRLITRFFQNLEDRDQEARDSIYGGFFKRILFEFNHKGLNVFQIEEYFRIIGFMTLICENQKVSQYYILRSPLFYHAPIMINGLYLQNFSIIAKLLSVGTFPQENQEYRQLFDVINMNNRQSYEQVIRTVDRVASNITRLVNDVYKLLLVIIQHTRREGFARVFEFMWNALYLNQSKTKSYQNPMDRASQSAFTVNLMKLLLQFSEKFTEFNNIESYLEQIDFSIIQSDPLISGFLKNFDCLHIDHNQNSHNSSSSSTQTNNNNNNNNNNLNNTPPQNEPISKEMEIGEENQETQEGKEKGEKEFITTNIVLLTVACIHINANQFEKYFKILEEISKNRAGANIQILNDLAGIKFAVEIMLFDQVVIERLLKFFNFFVFSVYRANGMQFHQFIDWKNQLDSLPKNSTQTLGMLPNFFISDFLRVMPFLEFLVIIMSNSEWCHYSHIRCSIVDLFMYLLPNENASGRVEPIQFYYIFSESEVFKRLLVTALLRISIDSQKTGQHTQFYDKFRFRYEMCKIFNYILKSMSKDNYVQSLLTVAQQRREMFLEFSNFYLSDIIYLLDEVLNKLKEMKQFQDTEEKLSQIEKQQKRALYETNQKQLKVFSLFLKAYYANFRNFSWVSQDIFLAEEIINKTVTNMNYTIKEISSQDASAKYKIKNFDQLEFKPLEILCDIIWAYINFSAYDQFKKEVILDSRSFDPDLFVKTAERVYEKKGINGENFQVFVNLMTQLKAEWEKKIQMEGIMQEDDTPEEFVDQISGEIMRDPYILPDQINILDQLTIQKILLHDQINPFNREPFTEQMIEPVPELQARIQEYLLKKKNPKKEVEKSFAKQEIQQEQDGEIQFEERKNEFNTPKQSGSTATTRVGGNNVNDMSTEDMSNFNFNEEFQIQEEERNRQRGEDKEGKNSGNSKGKNNKKNDFEDDVDGDYYS